MGDTNDPTIRERSPIYFSHRPGMLAMDTKHGQRFRKIGKVEKTVTRTRMRYSTPTGSHDPGRGCTIVTGDDRRGFRTVGRRQPGSVV